MCRIMLFIKMKRGMLLILKEPEIPKEILVMEALLRRLPEDHEMKQQIEADLANAKDTYEGLLRQHEVLHPL